MLTRLQSGPRLLRLRRYSTTALASLTEKRILTSKLALRSCFHTSSVYATAHNDAGVFKRIPLDYKWIRDNVEVVKENAANRQLSIADEVDRIAVVYTEYCEFVAQVSKLREEQKKSTQQIKRMQQEGRNVNKPVTSNADFKDIVLRSKRLKELYTAAEQSQKKAEQELWQLAQLIPNLTHPQSPIGGEENAVVIEEVGSKTEFDFNPKDHVQLTSDLGIVDFEAAARVSGRCFYYSKGLGAVLEMALIQFATAKLVRKGFELVLPPDVVRAQAIMDCGFQPRGEETQVYKLDGQHSDGAGDLCLAGTSEIPLAGLYAGKVFDETALPIKHVAISHCFRAEAGGPGAESRGLYRVHQFSKVEMFCITNEHDGQAMLDEILECQKEICDDLELHYKVLDMPTEELGCPAYRKYDIEAWMPGRNSYGEVCSASNCTDYQSRRQSIRYRRETDRSLAYAHTLNGTGLAVPRIVLALIENGQQSDGTIRLPAALQPYINAWGYDQTIP